MLQHGHTVRGGKSDRAARSTFADHDRDKRDTDLQAFLGRTGDRLGLSALFRALSREGSRRVNQSDDGKTKAIGQIHKPDRLAIPLRARHPKVSFDT